MTDGGRAGSDGDTGADDGPVVVLFTRDLCHLCDSAREVVRVVCDDAGVRWAEVDVDSTSARRSGAHDRWTDLVPVVTVEGRLLAHFRVDPGELAGALSGDRDR